MYVNQREQTLHKVMKIIQNTENVIEINKVLAALQYSFTHSY
jgi:hypothetical protein